MPRRSSAVVAPGKGGKCCCFCGLDDDNELDYGKIHEYSGIVTHYYCLLFSSNMQQQGLDEEGILGFLPGDIHKELKRGKRLVCSYCKKSGATLGCCNTKCKKIFHYPCGLKAGSLHQFFGEFRSYCIHHRPKQIIEQRILKELSPCEKKICYICYDEVNAKDDLGTIWAPCCKKNAWFHRTCVQQLAISAGYFFKCPLCNNKTEFQRAMLDHGIFIPSQDASWELVPNAFQELLYRHNRCDAEKCVCPKGREYTSTNAKWELTLCRTCGSQGIHMSCGNLKWGEPVWECNECTSILNRSMSSSQALSSSNESSRHRGSRVENNCSDEENSSDSEISVGNYTDGESAESLNPSGELQSSFFFPKAPSVEEKSPEKQRRDDTDKTGSSKSLSNVIEGQKPRDDEESNEELAPLTKKPKISLQRETSKDDSDDDDVIVVSGPSRREPCQALDKSWVLHHCRKTVQTGEVSQQRQDEPAKSGNRLQELSIVAQKVSETSTGSLTNPQVPFPVSNIEKPVPIEIDLSDSENSPITTSSTSVNPEILTNAKPSIPELNIQITNVTSLAPETFASASESDDQPADREEKTGEPTNPSAKPVYQRLEIVRLDVQPSMDNPSKPAIYGLTIPGTHNAVPLVFTRVDEPQSSPSSNQNNPPIPPSLSKLVGPKSRKAAILAAAASNNLANQPNAASIVQVAKSATPTLPNGEISALLSSKSTPPTTPTLENNKQPVARKLAATPDSYSKTEQTRENGISIVMLDRPVNGNSPIDNLVPKITTSTIPSSEYSAVSSPMSTAQQNQTNQRQTVSASHATMPTMQNNQRSNIVTVTIGCNDKPSAIVSKSTGSTIRSEDRWPLLAPKPTIQSNDFRDPSKPSASKLSYSLPLEAVVNDKILQSWAGKKLDTKKNVSGEKTPSKQNTSGGTLQKNDDPTNRINLTTTPASPPVTSKYFAQNVPANGFIPSRRIGIFTSKSPAQSSPNVASISSNSFAAQNVSHPAFPVGNTCELQNPRSPGISAKDTNLPLLNGIQRNLESLQNSFNGVDVIPIGSRTVSQPQKIPITPHSTDSCAGDKKSLDTPENCDGDAGTSLDVPPKRAVPADLKSNVRSQRNIEGTQDANDVSEKRRAEDVFRHDSQLDEEKDETTECSTATDRGHPPHRIGLINRTINLRDLKFELCGSSIVKMTLYETYCVNMKIEVGKKRKSASYKNYEVPKKNCSDLSTERTDTRSLSRGCDILRNTDGLHGFSGSLMSSCFSGNNENSGEMIGVTNQSSDNLQSNAVTKALELVSSNLTCGDGNSRGQDELKENLDPVPSSANIGTAGPIERKSKTRLRNGGVNTMQLLNEQDVQEKIIDEVTRNSPRKIGNQDNSLGTIKTSSNERKEAACGVARNLFTASDEEANNSRCENMAKMCKMRGARANEDEKMSERKSESPPKRPKYAKFKDLNDGTSSVNNSGFDNLPFGHIAEKVRNRKSPRINNVCKNDKLHSNNGSKNGLKPSRDRETKSDNSVCCKVSIDLSKIQTVIANKIHIFAETESSEFHKSETKNKRKKLEAHSFVRKFCSFDDLIVDQVCSSSIRTFSTAQTRKWKSDDDLLRCSKLEDVFARSNRFFYAENPRTSHQRNTLSFEKHDCVR